MSGARNQPDSENVDLILPLPAGTNTIGNVKIVDAVGNVIDGRSTTGGVTSVASNGANVTLLAANSLRKAATVFNDADKALYLKFGTTASATSFTVKIFPSGYFEFPYPCYSGNVDGIWDSGPTGSARITEST